MLLTCLTIDEEDIWERGLDSTDDFDIADYFGLNRGKDLDDEYVVFVAWTFQEC